MLRDLMLTIDQQKGMHGQESFFARRRARSRFSSASSFRMASFGTLRDALTPRSKFANWFVPSHRAAISAIVSALDFMLSPYRAQSALVSSFRPAENLDHLTIDIDGKIIQFHAGDIMSLAKLTIPYAMGELCKMSPLLSNSINSDCVGFKRFIFSHNNRKTVRVYDLLNSCY